jgi:hypothetical protein
MMTLKFRKKLVTGLKKPLGAKPEKTSYKSRFKRRTDATLEKIYQKREDRSRVGSMGKSIFNEELMEEFGLKEYVVVDGDHFIEILPISDDQDVEYFVEVAVHMSVGFANDKFICMHVKEGKKCYRCEQQSGMWDINREKAIEMYPRDRVIYLIWERTKELIEDEAPDYQLYLWNAPKKAVHKEISGKARNKMTKTNTDVSFPDKNEGKTIGFEVTKKGIYPQYGAFELHQRTADIPEAVLEQVIHMIDMAAEEGFNNLIDMFLYIPTYDEVKESVETEHLIEKAEAEKEASAETSAETGTIQNRFTRKQSNPPPVAPTVDETIELIQGELEELRTSLKSMNLIAYRKWCRENEYEEALEIKDKEEAIDAIIEDLFTKQLAEADINM